MSDEIRVTVLSQKADGVAKLVTLDCGSTVEDALEEVFPGDDHGGCTIRLNRAPCSDLGTELNDGDTITVSPQKVAGR